MLFYVVNTSARVSGSRSPHCKYDHLHPCMYECMPARADVLESHQLVKARSTKWAAQAKNMEAVLHAHSVRSEYGALPCALSVL
jgi:hypothetical protein